MKIIGYITTGTLLLIYGAILNGYALTKLWAWFIVPVFNAPILSLPSAIGLSMIVHYLHPTNYQKQKEEFWELFVASFFLATFKPLFALAVGSIVRLWIV